MRKDKEIAHELRSQGRSYAQIRAQLNIPKSTLSDWFRYNAESQKVKNFLTAVNRGISKTRLLRLDKVRGEHLRAIYKEAEEEAIKEFEYLKYHPLFIAGLSIYWGEGDKGGSLVRITNTDPAMIKLFLKFLKEICGAEEANIKFHILLYPDLIESTCKEYWVSQIGCLPGNFNKTVVIQGRHKTRRLQYGVCHITVCSSYLKKKMLKWLTLLPEALADKDYYNAGMV